MKSVYWLLAAVFAGLLAAGSVYDLAFSLTVFRPDNAAALFLERFGAMPGNLLLVLFPAGLVAAAFAGRTTLSRAGGVVLLAGGGVLVAAGCAVFLSQLIEEGGLNAAVSAVVTAFFAAAAYLGFHAAAKKEPDAVYKIALIGTATMIGAHAAVAVIKIIWGRQRFFTMDDPLTQFTAWFLPQGRASGDAYKSFPSGHSCAAGLLVCLLLFPTYLPVAARLKKAVVAVLVLYIPCVMVSRIVIGRHFISDVTAGAAIPFVVFFLFKFTVEKYFYLFKKICYKP
ncbi:MAG: phosphatase PAP2 family protein [Spirochaetaceae bacterium]|nr:phosphatase PAP2 family protein [Spirochaetaceae bacterium]